MSIPVALDALSAEVARFGPVALLATSSTDDSGPHVASVLIAFDAGRLTTGAGRRTRANVGAHPAVTLVWPAIDALCLIVDGTATIAADETLLVQPTAAVLHKLPLPGTAPNAS